jgi:transposase
MILDLHRQGVSVTSIARQSGLDRKTVHRYIERGLEPASYGADSGVIPPPVPI